MTELLHLMGFKLEFTRETFMHFFHGPAMYATILDRLGNPKAYPDSVGILCPERGRTRFLPGQNYSFGLSLIPGRDPAPWEMVRLLASRPETRFGQTDFAPFGDNYRITEVRDLVKGTTPGFGEPLAALCLEDLAQAADDLAQAREIIVRFLSPLVIYRAPLDQRINLMDGEVFEPTKLLDRVIRRLDELWPDLELARGLDPTGVSLVTNRMLRTDVSYPKKRIQGCSGSVVLRFPDKVGDWALPLLLAGIVGVGKTTNMGKGRFEVMGFPLPCDWPPQPAQTILQRAASRDNLRKAREETVRGGPAAGVDGLTRDEFVDALSRELPDIISWMEEARIPVEPLKGLLIEEHKEEGRTKLRPLAIPTIRERFIQRAVAQEIGPAIDQLLEDSAFAYRRGLSHRTAARSVQSARKEGWEFVFDADIRAFFDQVDWDLLRIRLEACFGDDPVVDAVMAWVKAPVDFEGRTIHRERGLPQGAVVSPFLANLYLDKLDEAMDAEGFRLVRYADDFVVLVKKKADLARVREVVTHQLTALNLELNEEKTRDTSFEQGFTFLGTLFCKSVVLEVEHPSRQVSQVLDKAPPLPREDAVATSGWFAQFRKDLLEEAAEEPEVRWRKPVTTTTKTRRPLYILSFKTKLTCRKKGLCIIREGEPPEFVDWQQVSEIILIGGRYLSPAVIQRSLQQRIPISFHRYGGEPVGMLLPHGVRSPSPVALLQWEWARDPARSLEVARALVMAKIRNTRLFVRRKPGDTSVLLRHLRSMVLEAEQSDTLERLRGIEGRAAAAYFSQWPKWLENHYPGFPGREHRGTEDPANVMLNFLYTHLHRQAQMALFAEGLDAYLGVMHEGRGRYAALASDMMEPFRFLVDRVVQACLNGKKLGRRDFIYDEKGRYRVKLKEESLKLLILEYETVMAQEVADASGTVRTYQAHLQAQVKSLRKHIEEDLPFQSFNLKW